MSLNSLAASQVARESERSANRRAVTGASDDTLYRSTDMQNALSALVEFVPTETVTMYLACLTAAPVIAVTIPGFNAKTIYWSFAVLTPLLYALIYMGKRRTVGKRRWPGWSGWPWWPTVAATIAFLAWGTAVPEAPYLDTAEGRVASGLLAIVVSTLLGVLARVFSSQPR